MKSNDYSFAVRLTIADDDPKWIRTRPEIKRRAA
jgi:hypothetical protein